MEKYWKELKQHLESGVKTFAGDIRDGDDIFRVESSEDDFKLSLFHNGEALVKLVVSKGEKTIDQHTVLANGNESDGSFEIRDGHLASVNSDSYYFFDAAHASAHFLRPATYAVYDPPFNIPKR